jgi:hypothetical protein
MTILKQNTNKIQAGVANCMKYNSSLTPEQRSERARKGGIQKYERLREREKQLEEEFERKTELGKKSSIIDKVMNEKYEFDKNGCSKFEYLFRETFKKVIESDDIAEQRKFMEFTLNNTGEKPKDQIDIKHEGLVSIPHAMAVANILREVRIKTSSESSKLIEANKELNDE